MTMDAEQVEDPIFPTIKKLRLVWIDHCKGEVVSSMWWDPVRLKYEWHLKGKGEKI